MSDHVSKMLLKKHISLNVDGRKRAKPQSIQGIIGEIPKKLRSNFTRMTGYGRRQGSSVSTPTPATRSSKKNSYGEITFEDGPTPFSPSVKKSSTLKTVRAQPTPSPAMAMKRKYNDIEKDSEPVSVSPSIKDLGVRRLLPQDILDISIGDQIIIVIPIDRDDEPDAVMHLRGNVKCRVKSRIIESLRPTFAGLSGEERDTRFDELISEKHIVQREGRYYCQFAATVTSFPHRDDYATYSIQTADLAIRQGGSFAVDLHDYPLLNKFELRLDEVPSVEVWKGRTDNDIFNDNISFSCKVKDVDSLNKSLQEHLSLVYGDWGSTMEVLYKFYQAKSLVLSAQVSKLLKGGSAKANKSNKSTRDLHWDMLQKELNNNTLGQFLKEADQVWYNAIVLHYSMFHNISEELIEESKYLELYYKMEELFPHHVDALINTSVSNLFWEPARSDENVLSSKKKTVLMHFFALCRARNKEHMIHWAIVETLGIFGKGISQSTTRSSAGKNFCCTLEHALRILDAIYDKCQPAVKDLLRSEPTISFVLDNYQRSIKKRHQTGGRAALFHHATASSVMRNKVPAPPIGSIIKSPSDILYRVTAIKRETPYLMILSIVLASPTTSEATQIEMDCVVDGLMWPSINLSWTLESIPGLDTVRPISYVGQHVPSMVKFRVDPSVCDDELLFHSLKRKAIPTNGESDIMDVKRYHKLIRRRERIQDLETHCKLLRAQEPVRKILEHNQSLLQRNESERYDYEGTSAEAEFAPSDVDLKSAALCDIMDSNSKHVANAQSFQNDMVRLANPMVGTADQFYFHPLHPSNETTNDGALRAIVNGYVNMNLLEELENDTYRFVGDGRFAFEYGDQLTEQRLCNLKPFVIKSLAKIGYEDYVDNLVKALDSSMIQHDYLHETFHMLEAIYIQYWGAFLQPLAILTGTKRVSGTPLKSGKIIDHHNHLVKIYRAAKRYRSQKFIEKLEREELRMDNNATTDSEQLKFLLNVEALYEEFCSNLETSNNELSKMCAMFIMKVESYLRCKKAIRKHDVLLLECETNDWLGMWKETGKTSYLKAGLRRIENLYYTLKPWLLECCRYNRLPTWNVGRGSLAFDEGCELHNLMLKQLPMTPYIDSVVSKSKHLSLIRRCAVELWGKGKVQQSSSETSMEGEMCQLIEFFQTTEIFSDAEEVTMDENTLWSLVNVPKANGTAADEKKVSMELPSHEKLLINSLNMEGELGGIDEDEFERMLNGNTIQDDDESVCSCDTRVEIDCSGTFDDENLPDMDMSSDDMRSLGNDENRAKVLKKLGNSKHKTFNKQALENSFVKGAMALNNIKAIRQKEIEKEKKAEQYIRLAVKYFVQERNKRRRIMIEQTEKEKSGEIHNGVLDDWEIEYLEDRSINK